MHPRLFTLSLGFGALILAGAEARAQGPTRCAERQTVIEALQDRFGETRHAQGQAGPRGTVELFAAPDTGTWTITITLPSGLTCLMAAGDGFQALDEPPPPRGAPA